MNIGTADRPQNMYRQVGETFSDSSGEIMGPFGELGRYLIKHSNSSDSSHFGSHLRDCRRI